MSMLISNVFLSCESQICSLSLYCIFKIWLLLVVFKFFSFIERLFVALKTNRASWLCKLIASYLSYNLSDDPYFFFFFIFFFFSCRKQHPSPLVLHKSCSHRYKYSYLNTQYVSISILFYLKKNSPYQVSKAIFFIYIYK
jgi:hypothetical protein